MGTLDDLLRVQNDFNISVDVVEPLPRCITDNPTKYEQFFKRDCAAGKATIAISASGQGRPCTHISEEYGDLIKEDLATIWKRLRPWRDGKYIPKECYLCEERNICSYGCREAAKVINGDYSSMEPWATKPVPINRKRLEIPEVPKDVYLRVIPNLRYRKEAKGYFIFSPRDHSGVYANEELFKILIFLSKKEKFKLKDLENNENREKWSNIVKLFK